MNKPNSPAWAKLNDFFDIFDLTNIINKKTSDH